VVLIVSPFQRQSNIPFDTINSIIDANPEMGKRIGRVRTATKMYFKNGSKIYSLPAGRDAKSIRGFTPNLMIIDEAALVPDKAWTALEPSLLQTDGTLLLVSTPQARVGRFFSAFDISSGFSTYHVTCYDCPTASKEVIEEQKRNLTENDFKREVLGEFVEEAENYFPIRLVDSCVEGEEVDFPETGARYSLAVDFARYGVDETVYMIGETLGTIMRVVKTTATKKQPSTDAIERIKELHHIWGFNYIYLDESGLGGAIVDVLLDEKLPVVACPFNFKAKSEYYKNLKFLMEHGRIKFYKHPKLIKQLIELIGTPKMWGIEIKTRHGKHDDYPDALALLCKDLKGPLEEEKDDGFIK